MAGAALAWMATALLPTPPSGQAAAPSPEQAAIDTGVGATYLLCPDILVGKLALDDAQAMGKHGFVPGPVRPDGSRIASNVIGDSEVVIEVSPSHDCRVLMIGPFKSEFIRAAIIFAAHNGRQKGKGHPPAGVVVDRYDVVDPSYEAGLVVAMVDDSSRTDAMTQVKMGTGKP